MLGHHALNSLHNIFSNVQRVAGVDTDGDDNGHRSRLNILKYSKSNAFITKQIVYLSDKYLHLLHPQGVGGQGHSPCF